MIERGKVEKWNSINTVDSYTLTMSQMTREEAIKELGKVTVAFRMLESGTITAMSGEDFSAFRKWLN